MEKTTRFIWIISIATLCVLGFIFYNTISKHSNDTVKQKNITQNDIFLTNDESEFSDGLTNPVSTISYDLGEDDIGITEKSIYLIDINNDKALDRITKFFFENGNAHSYYEYKIELNKNGNYVDITPENFRTVNGADCDLQQIKFVFKPKFKVIMIYREMGETWINPTMAYRQVLFMSGDKIQKSESKKLREICDVKELF